MTDKELAKESWWNDDGCSGAMSTEKIYECGFLAGLKAGRPKWHKVADGDLPKDDIKLAIIEIDDCGYLLCNYHNGFWYDANSGATCAEWITNNIIAWKEIIPPKESE